ncbi:MAG: cytochrome c oxidase subunit I [Caldilineaceae bacterium]
MTTVAQPLRRVWETPTSLAGTLTSVDHKVIGVRYIVTGFIFFLLGGIQALIMRTQLAVPENTLVNPQIYNELFTMHGTTMIFFFATPILFGFGNYFIPLMIGARDMAFPRLNAFGYWIFLFSGLLLYSSYLFGLAPDGGWFNYVPLTTIPYSPSLNIDFYALGLLFLGISTTAGAVNFIVTLFKLRAPDMSINRMPLFCWAILATSFAVIFAYPTLNVANLFLELDRKINTHFYDPVAGGNVLLWQHLFWFFGHPDVYIIFLPAVGMVSDIISTFSRRPVVGYTYLALAAVATAIISFGVWVHHMFAVGLPPLSYNFYSAATMVITIPTGIQIFAWIATIWMGRPYWTTAFLFVLGFIVNFVIGGLSGVMFAVVPFDQQVTDSYFVVAHFHYVLIGGMVFPLFGAFYYWLPKITGRLMDETLGAWNFWTMFVGFNLTFFPMHIAGLLGMPRRYYTYEPGVGLETLNQIETIGAYLLAFGILLFIINWIWSLRSGAEAGDNPWNAGTLEWATTSPPPPYNFRVIPTVTSGNPLWHGPESEPARHVRRLEETEEPAAGVMIVRKEEVIPPNTVVEEVAVQTPPANVSPPEPTYRADPYARATLITTLLDGQPEAVVHIPEDSYWPFVLAIGLAILFIGALISQLAVIGLGVVVAIIALIGWLWPEDPHGEENYT